MEMGRSVLSPYGDSERYDLVVSEGDSFVKVQAKKGWVDEQVSGGRYSLRFKEAKIDHPNINWASDNLLTERFK